METPIAPSYKNIDSIKVRFGKRLHEVRTGKGLTQLKLADRDWSGKDRSFISDIERGKKSPSLETLESIAVAFDMSISELLKDV